MSADELRQAFLDYFADREHKILRSSPLVPEGDATLLFTNAGMVQFKEIFTGRQQRPAARATTSQKCVRAGGKHNDLENVGRTARHHTFFEMLGNFSFADYFKSEACAMAWDFLTKTLELPAERLWITIFETDDEAQRIWTQEIGVPAERVLRCGEKDNFWAMGDTGPCGPCTEIHWDRHPEASGDPLADDSRLLELWNVVFMQFERNAEGELTPLVRGSIDTGAGLERLAAVLRGEASNYHTDLFLPIIEGTAKDGGVAYERSDRPEDVALRVIADHARATTFLVADGVLPGNLGRGYVLRRIIRRAIRHGECLDFSGHFFAAACDRVITRMQVAYPELKEARELILKVAENEESAFRRTLDRGLALLEQAFAGLETGDSLPGETAFQLYDTYGFPLDLTRLIAEERGLGLDEDGFEAAMAVQKEQSRGALGVTGTGAVFHELSGRIPATEFIGYPDAIGDGLGLSGKGEVVALLQEQMEVDQIRAGAKGIALVDRTPFYGESGGQIGDAGELQWPGGRAEVHHTGKQEGLHTLEITVIEGDLAVGCGVDQQVDGLRRQKIRANHSATHLLQAALQEVLGDHVGQAGSAVGPDRLRFDFTHFAALTPDEKQAVEAHVNHWVVANHGAETVVMDLDEARSAGAVAMFGEKYDEEVRTVRLGPESFELCGGTHVSRTGDIGFFKIVSESAIAAGQRRIEAVTGSDAVGVVHQTERDLAEHAGLLKTSPAQLGDRIRGLQGQLKAALTELEALKSEVRSGQSTELVDQAQELDGIRYIAAHLPDTDGRSLRELADTLRDRLGEGVVMLAGDKGPKAFLQIAVSKELAGRAHAGQMIKALASHIGGGGGGRPDMAQAGGGNPQGIPTALEAFPDALRASLSS
ncbi:MAG: alanine--tRNA ligase [Myxococcales bacterium]|nr:alanine--tRNA ligase [Myxococcales bacterium]